MRNYFFKVSSNYSPIRNSEKIKWVYLKENPLRIKTVAFKGYDDPEEVMNFIEEHVDYEKLFKSALEKKVRVFYEALQWEMPLDKELTLEKFF